MGRVLLVEPDSQFSARVMASLRSHGSAISWQQDYAEGRLEQIHSELSGPPDVVVVNSHLPSGSSFELCGHIKSSDPDATVILLASDPAAKQAAYTHGCDDYLPLPVDEEELTAKIILAVERRRRRNQLQEELEQVRTTAFQAMMMSSELGLMLRFLQTTLVVTDYDELAAILFEVLEEMGLQGSMQFLTDSCDKFYSQAPAEERQQDADLLSACYGGKRLVDEGERTVICYPNCLLLIRNMPLDDDERYGMLRDNLCILLEMIQSRLQAIELQRAADQRRKALQVGLNVLGRTLGEMDRHQREFTAASGRILDDMMLQMRAEFCSLDLNEEEELKLQQQLEGSGDALHQLFQTSRQRDAVIRQIMQKLMISMRA